MSIDFIFNRIFIGIILPQIGITLMCPIESFGIRHMITSWLCVSFFGVDNPHGLDRVLSGRVSLHDVQHIRRQDATLSVVNGTVDTQCFAHELKAPCIVIMTEYVHRRCKLLNSPQDQLRVEARAAEHTFRRLVGHENLARREPVLRFERPATTMDLDAFDLAGTERHVVSVCDHVFELPAEVERVFVVAVDEQLVLVRKGAKPVIEVLRSHAFANMNALLVTKSKSMQSSATGFYFSLPPDQTGTTSSASKGIVKAFSRQLTAKYIRSKISQLRN